MEELYRKILLYSKRIRMETGNTRCIYGEVYADMVLGALLSAVEDEKCKEAVLVMAFKDFRDEYMCVSLERECIAKNAMHMAEKCGVTQTIIEMLDASEELFKRIDTLVEKYKNEIKLK